MGIISQLGNLFFYGNDIKPNNIQMCPNKKDYMITFTPTGPIWLHQIELLINAIDSAQSPTHKYYVMRNTVLIGATIAIFVVVDAKTS